MLVAHVSENECVLKNLTQSMLPPLAKLSLSEIGAKRKFGDADGTEATEAEKLLKILEGLTEESGRSIDWVLELSNTQFDMLLSMRLYTGSLYKIMARVFYDTSDDTVAGFVHPDAKATAQILLESKYGDHIDWALYYALCNAKRRAPEKMTGPLFAGSREMRHLVLPEEQFRKDIAFELTEYTEHSSSFLPSPNGSMLNTVMERISGKGIDFNQLQEVEEFRDAWLNNPDALAEHALKDFWFGMRHIAGALKSLILESKVVVGGDVAMPVYRGMKEDFDKELAEDSLVSVSRDEEVSRHFTKNGDLDWEYDDIGAPNQCCMVRMSLLVGTPYLDVDAALRNTNGWGYALGEKELLLPPGLEYERGPNEGPEGQPTYMAQPARFPMEIDESEANFDDIENWDSEREPEDIPRYFEVEYWIVGPG